MIASPDRSAVADAGAPGSGPPAGVRTQRARPLLGTVVSIAIDGLAAAEAHRSIQSGFEAIEQVHELMSFHEAGSEISRLNREAARRAVRVDPRTFAVLSKAIGVAAASGGVFDVTVARELVEAGILPEPTGVCAPDPHANWRDIELTSDGRVRFHRPLWIDLGGIAKGAAVDQAIERMRVPPRARCCVNAGGDLRVSGSGEQTVYLKCASSEALRPALVLQNASLASSGGTQAAAGTERLRGPHIHGVYRRALGWGSFASVVHRECLIADALTKVVLADGVRSDALLRRFGASALLHLDGRGWSRWGMPE